ncbi:trehalase-like domain-containing protein, partial [Asanoa sp. NPDC050611]|uniref:trehalase-like domain-containing protein n=1 Tax=Asanoa sp. NPDC050611 TaxID=3157098 RepID=UPI0033CEBED9
MEEQRYLPIGEHGLIGNLRTVALVGTDGTIDWCCVPRFDAPSVFASVLDRDKGGFFAVTTDVPATTKQFYFPDTNVLITRFLSDDGIAEIQDFMPVPGDRHEAERFRLIRRVRCVRGELPFRAHVAPRFDYGLQPHTLRMHDGRAVFESASLSLALSSTAPFELVDGDVLSSFRLKQGEDVVFCLDRAEMPSPPLYGTAEQAEEAFTATVEYWRRWLSASRYRGR